MNEKLIKVGFVLDLLEKHFERIRKDVSLGAGTKYHREWALRHFKDEFLEIIIKNPEPEECEQKQ